MGEFNTCVCITPRIGRFLHKKAEVVNQNVKFWRLFGSVISIQGFGGTLHQTSGFEGCLTALLLTAHAGKHLHKDNVKDDMITSAWREWQTIQICPGEST